MEVNTNTIYNFRLKNECKYRKVKLMEKLSFGFRPFQESNRDFLESVNKQPFPPLVDIERCLMIFASSRNTSALKKSEIIPKIVTVVGNQLHLDSPKLTPQSAIYFIYCSYVWKGKGNVWAPSVEGLIYRAVLYVSKTLNKIPADQFNCLSGIQSLNKHFASSLSYIVRESRHDVFPMHDPLAASTNAYLIENIDKLEPIVIGNLLFSLSESRSLSPKSVERVFQYFLVGGREYLGRSFVDIVFTLLKYSPRDQHHLIFDQVRKDLHVMISSEKTTYATHWIKVVKAVNLPLPPELRVLAIKALYELVDDRGNFFPCIEAFLDAFDCGLVDDALYDHVVEVSLERIRELSLTVFISFLKLIVKKRRKFCELHRPVYEYLSYSFHKISTKYLVKALDLAILFLQKDEMDALMKQVRTRVPDFSTEELAHFTVGYHEFGYLTDEFYYYFILRSSSLFSANLLTDELFDVSMGKLPVECHKQLFSQHVKEGLALPKIFFSHLEKRITSSADDKYGLQFTLDLIVAMRIQKLDRSTLIFRMIAECHLSFFKLQPIDFRLIFMYELLSFFRESQRIEIAHQIESRLECIPSTGTVHHEILLALRQFYSKNHSPRTP
ncbi:MAG: hypothetical protein MRY21_07365 [Simkaniaceae bacterium]|nr:hypothetical protein [Simkaniaceae bacterium]